MNKKKALAGMLILSSTLSKNEVDAELTAQTGLGISAARGFCTGMICAGIKSITSNAKESLRKHEAEIINTAQEKSPENNDVIENKGLKGFASKITKGALNNFPVDFGVNAVATTYVDRLFGTKKQTAANIRSLALPVATMELTKEIIKDANIPPIAKSAIIYGGFWAGRMSQGKNPLTTAVAVSGFAAGAQFIKSVNQKTASDTDDINEKTIKPREQKGLYVSAVTGYMPSSTRNLPDNANDTAEDHFKRRIGVPKETELWPLGYDKFTKSYTSYLVPISDEEYRSLSR